MRAKNTEIIAVVEGLCRIIEVNELLLPRPGIEHIVAKDQERYDAAQSLLVKLAAKHPKVPEVRR